MFLCLSLSPRICSKTHPLSRWCHPTSSSSTAGFFSCLQYFPASGWFPISQPFASGGQSIAASASAPVLSMNIQGWFPLGLTGLISLQSKGLSRVSSQSACMRASKSLQSDCVWLFATLWTIACQAPLSIGFSQARKLEWVALPFSRASSWPRDQALISFPALEDRFFTTSKELLYLGSPPILYINHYDTCKISSLLLQQKPE